MRGIFYSPFVKANATAPSGASQMASLLRRAFDIAGIDIAAPDLPSTYDGKGDPRRQAELRLQSGDAAAKLLALIAAGTIPKPDFWFSYHVYYKSPDWIGPEVSKRLSIPYVIAEGSHAPKRQSGPWALAHDATTVALGSAALLLAMTQFDRVCLEWIDPARVRDFRPFIDVTAFKDIQRVTNPEVTRLLAVGMMRNDRKRDSYRLLAQALNLLDDLRCELTIAGDGKFRNEIEGYFSGQRGVSFPGAISRDQLPVLMSRSDIFTWPGVGEAYGLAYLEAQAAGLPVVALRERGVVDVTVDGETALLSDAGDASGLAQSIRRLATEPRLRSKMSACARAFVCHERSLEAAAERLHLLLMEILA
ncbi:MAG: glycosyltransferase family 4 protein [Micropepsaceae bacterium]